MVPHREKAHHYELPNLTRCGPAQGPAGGQIDVAQDPPLCVRAHHSYLRALSGQGSPLSRPVSDNGDL